MFLGDLQVIAADCIYETSAFNHFPCMTDSIALTWWPQPPNTARLGFLLAIFKN